MTLAAIFSTKPGHRNRAGRARPSCRAGPSVLRDIPASARTRGIFFNVLRDHLSSRQLLGVRLDPEVYYIDRLPVHVSGWDFLAVAASAMLICTLATIYPAYMASKLRPVDGLRYE